MNISNRTSRYVLVMSLTFGTLLVPYVKKYLEYRYIITAMCDKPRSQSGFFYELNRTGIDLLCMGMMCVGVGYLLGCNKSA